MTMQSFSIPFVTFLKEVDSAVDTTDFMAGFVKSFVFAILIAGDRMPARTADAARALRRSANPRPRAVVSGIILLVIVDGMFAVVYYVLDI